MGAVSNFYRSLELASLFSNHFAKESVTLYCQAWAKNIDTERIYVDKVDKNWKKNPSRLEDYYDICLAGASQWRRQLHCLLWGAYNHHQVNILLKQIVVSKNENVIFSEGRSERVQKGRWLEDFTTLASSHWFVLCMCRPVSQTYMMSPLPYHILTVPIPM